ncbi:MAG TPA: polysaccharide deacetylase family protein [Gemmatimonadaceae bacterium]|jgi:peptidoglycan/xylan/chitin deacetylase (PgdA/CDA1 family)|nr:polysaccharide deacetylase family protein [Gemmatimonadaceae bacterium]
MHSLGLEYHDVIAGNEFDSSGFPGAASASYKLSECDFVAHLDAIGATGAHVSRADRMASMESHATPVFLTFDDGGVGALSQTAPLLEARGWVGHFFVVSDRIGTAGFLDADGIRELHRRGHLVGSHSCSHPLRFSGLSMSDMVREWKDSRTVLEDILHAEVTTASVPGGYYRTPAAEAAAQAGYRTLFTSEPMTRVRKVRGCLVLGRYSIRRSTTPAIASALVVGRGAARGRQWATWNAKKVIKAAGGNVYLAIREVIFERAHNNLH